MSDPKIIGNILKALPALAKVKVSLPVAFSAFVGFIMFAGNFHDFGWIYATTGVFILASASSILNQIQEQRYDAKMNRTKNRPFVRGSVSIKQGIFVLILFFSTGCLSLYLGGGMVPVLLGIVTMIWYNGFYTPLKRVTAFAVIPGALVGAIPPVIGWVSAGGHITDNHAVFMAFFFFIGQIPHFWLIVLKHSDDYRKAGFATLSDLFSVEQILRLTFFWILATAISAIMLNQFGIINQFIWRLIIIVLSTAVCATFVFWAGGIAKPSAKTGFTVINIFYLLVMVIMVLDKLT